MTTAKVALAAVEGVDSLVLSVWTLWYCLCGLSGIVCVDSTVLFVWTFWYCLCELSGIFCVDSLVLSVWTLRYFVCGLSGIVCVDSLALFDLWTLGLGSAKNQTGKALVAVYSVECTLSC